MRVFLCLAALALIASCGGRVSQPISLENTYDDRLSCAHLSGERDNNFKRLEELTGEKEERLVNNMGLLIASPLFLDFSDTIKKEVEAIVARNERIGVLMASKSCPQAAPIARAEDNE